MFTAFEIIRSTKSDTEKIELLKTKELDIKNEHGACLLHEASYKSGVPLLEWLLNQCPELIHAKSNKGTNVLFYAVKYNNIPAVDFFLKHKNGRELLEQTNYESTTINYFAALSGNIELLTRLARERRDPCFNVKNHKKQVNIALQEASGNGHLLMVQYLVKEKGADPFISVDGGWFPIHYAANQGHTEIVRFYVAECKMQVDFPCADDYEGSPLHIAAANGQLGTVKSLITESKADYRRPNKKGSAPLHIAAYNGHIPVINFLATLPGIDVNSPTEDKLGQTPLILAITGNQLATVKALVENHHANYLLPDKDGGSPVEYVVGWGRNDILAYFLNPVIGAPQPQGPGWNQSLQSMRIKYRPPLIKNVNMIDKDGNTLFANAVDCGHFDTAQYLAEKHHADFQKANKEGDCPIHIAAKQGHVEILSYLIVKLCVDPHLPSRNEFGERPLHLAAGNGHLECVIKLTTTHKANHLAPSGKGVLAIHSAAHWGHTHIVEFFVTQLGMDINVPDQNGQTPLHHAVAKNQINTVLWLINHGASQDVEDNNGNVPLLVAAFSNSVDSIIALYSVSMFIGYRHEQFLELNHRKLNAVILCCLANDTGNPKILLARLKEVFRISDWVVSCGMNEETLLAIAQQQKQYMAEHKCNYLEIYTIERSLKGLRDSLLVEKGFFKKLGPNLTDCILKCRLPDYLKTQPKKILHAMNSRHGGSQLTFWRKMNKPHQDQDTSHAAGVTEPPKNRPRYNGMV